MNWQSNKHLHTFHGGIHPPENKDQSTQTPIEAALLPDKLILPLQQHIGQQAKPLVQVGDCVLKGQMIAEPTGYVSAAVHAPTSGTITAIETHALPHPSGLSELCIIIKPDGKDDWAELSPVADYQQLDTPQLLQHISNAGITGLGGAGFPTSVKLNPSKDLNIDTLILNAAECEPYITADDMLMRERAEEIIQGLQIMAHILQPEKCLIGIETNKPQAIEALQLAIESLQLSELIHVERIPVKYPSGGEKQLIQILTGKEVPNGGFPADIGIVCHNIGTAVAVYHAIAKGEPLISRITTITGDAVSRQGNIEVLLGTPIESLLAHFEIKQDKLHRLVMGGPMMGFTLDDISLPVVKASNCVLAATRKELPDPAPEQACIRCGMCAEACPATLLPQQLYWFSKSREFDKALSHNLLDCIECGACSYVCPSNIPLVQYYRFAKGEIRIEEHERTSSDHARQRFEARTARLEQEEAEKEAKRQARGEAAAASKKAKETANEAGDKKAVDPKAAVVQAALERAKARKAKKAAEAKGDADAPSTEQAKDAAPAMSAVERAKARKAARATEQDGDDTATTKSEEKAGGLSALEKAKAKRAQNSDTEKTEDKGLSALERAKAKRASGNDDQAAEASIDSVSNADSKPAKAMSALEKAKAKRAQAATQDSSEQTAETKPMSALERAKAKRAEAAKTGTAEAPAKSDDDNRAENNEAKPLSALERAKLKRAQAASESGNKAAEDKTTENINKKPLSALERAKAKRAEAAAQSEPVEAEKDVEKETTAPTVPVEEKPAAPMSALERAKAKRAEKAAQQAAADSTADTENRD
jgi:H+/Na+-translocating ferredoxin:NAD+ oxidoreductase subunit C